MKRKLHFYWKGKADKGKSSSNQKWEIKSGVKNWRGWVGGQIRVGINFLELKQHLENSELTLSASKHSEEWMGLAFVNLSIFISLSATITGSSDAGDKLSSILWADGWRSIGIFMEQFLKELTDNGLSTEFTGYIACINNQKYRTQWDMLI